MCVFPPGGSSDLDLDAILGDLCELESQIVTAQTEINDSLRKNSSSDNAPAPSKAPCKAPVAPPVAPEVPENVQWDEALDDQLQHALSFLNDITSVPSFKELDTKVNNNNNKKDLDTNSKFQGQGQSSRISSHSRTNCDIQGNDTSPNSDALQTILLRTESLSREISLDNQTSSHDLSPGTSAGAADETDSAFSDNTSLPSSGSHVSVSTSVSGNSGGGSGGAASSVSSTATDSVSEGIYFSVLTWY